MDKNKCCLLVIIAVLLSGSCLFSACQKKVPEQENNPEISTTASQENTSESTQKSTGTTIPKKQYEVSFLSDDGTVLKVDLVDEEASADPPKQPSVSYGKIFTRWDTDISRITKDVEVKPVCKDVSGLKNVIALSGAYGKKGDIVSIPLVLCGEVNICGFEMTVEYDPDKLKLEKVYEEDGGIIINNETEGTVYINYSSVSNTKGDVDLCMLDYKPLFESGEVSVTLNVKTAYEVSDGDDLSKTEINAVSSVVTVLP